jgi:hypothetical protein
MRHCGRTPGEGCRGQCAAAVPQSQRLSESIPAFWVVVEGLANTERTHKGKVCLSQNGYRNINQNQSKSSFVDKVSFGVAQGLQPQ